MLRRSRVKGKLKPLEEARVWLKKKQDPPGFQKVFIDQKIGML